MIHSRTAPVVLLIVSSTIEDSAAIIECTVIEQSGFRLHRFLIFDDFRLILVEPEVSRVGFGIVRLVAAMEHVTVGVLLSIFHLLLLPKPIFFFFFFVSFMSLFFPPFF